MKKNLFFAALASIALVGCTSDETVDQVKESQKIKFDNPVMSLSTKAPGFEGEIVGSEYPAAEKFDVYARVYTGTFNGWTASSEAADFWTDSETASKGASGYWETTGSHYWPNDPYKLAFAAYSPSAIVTDGDAASITYGQTGFSIVDFKTQDVLDEQYDLMYSSRNVDCDKTNCLSGVPVKFNHALSSVVFGAIENVDGKTYRITGFEIEGTFIDEADFNENITETPAVAGVSPYSETSAPAWTNPSAAVAKNYAPSAFVAFNVPESANLFTSGESALLPIPQDVPADAKIILTYEVTQDGSTLDYTKEIKLSDFKDSSSNTIGKWEIGKRYKYIIHFGGTSKIYFDPSVNDWVDGGTVQVTI